MSPQLTSTFKLTLLASIAIHAVAFVQWGGTRSGFHNSSQPSTVNIFLSQTTNIEPSPQTEDNRPDNEKGADFRNRKKHNSKQQQAKDKPKTKVEPIFKQSGEIRKTSGNPQAGIVVKQQYIARLLQHLDRYKTYPFIAQRRGLEGKVNMEIKLDGSGRLLQITCLSNNRLFCDSATQTARRAVPLPVPPASLPMQCFQYAMEYKLR